MLCRTISPVIFMMQRNGDVDDEEVAADRDESYEKLHEEPLKADPSNELLCGECEEEVVQE